MNEMTSAECGALDGCNPPAHQFVPLDHASRNRASADRYIAEARAALRGRAVRPDTEEHHHDA